MTACYPYQRDGDFFTLGNVCSPGLCEFDRADAPLGYDERRGYGLSGAYVFFKGEELSKFGVKIRVCPGGDGFEAYPTIQDWMEGGIWRDFHAVYQKPPTGTRPKALQLVHPITAELGIGAVVTLNDRQWMQTGHGEWTKGIEFCTYRVPRKRLAGGFTTPATPVPTTPADQRLKDALDEQNRLLGARGRS